MTHYLHLTLRFRLEIYTERIGFTFGRSRKILIVSLLDYGKKHPIGERIGQIGPELWQTLIQPSCEQSLYFSSWPDKGDQQWVMSILTTGSD